MDASQAGGMLDVLNSVGQATGLSMDTLSTDLSQNAAQLKAMGFNATQSAQFLGNVEMSGLDVGTAMAAMKKAMNNAAKDGKTLDQALGDFSTTMKSNKSDTEKLQAAYDLFGSKGGAAIFNAMQTGKLSLTSVVFGSVGDAKPVMRDSSYTVGFVVDSFCFCRVHRRKNGLDVLVARSAGELTCFAARFL